MSVTKDGKEYNINKVKKFNPKNENIQLADVLDRIRAAKSLKDQKDAGELLGIQPSNLSKKKASNSVPIEKIQLLCVQENLNEEWVFTGRGSINNDEPQESNLVGGSYKRVTQRESDILAAWRELTPLEQDAFELLLNMKRGSQ